MKSLKVQVTPDAKADLKRYLSYLRKELGNKQAAKSVALDFRNTKDALSHVAVSLAKSDNDKLRAKGLKRINFGNHNYFLLYRIVDDIVQVTNMFHGSEDFESKLR